MAANHYIVWISNIQEDLQISWYVLYELHLWEISKMKKMENLRVFVIAVVNLALFLISHKTKQKWNL